jgi:tetratricopeptide (TPR) repeat protein
MALLLLLLLLVQIFSGLVHASDESSELLRKAREARVTEQQETAARLAAAAVKQDPNNLEARWFLVSSKLRTLTNVHLTDRATTLAIIAPEFSDLADMARKAKRTAFLHYITAMYAHYYNNYERASAEIEKAVQLEPKSARYVGAKGLLLARHGHWIEDDKRIELGIRYLRQSAELPCSEPDLVDEPCERDFQIALAIGDLKRPRWPEAAAHYERYLKTTKYKSSAYNFAWNNLSIAYRHMGECQKAKDAAETALKMKTFGAAEMNRNRAEFCLEMQKLGMAPKPKP